MSQRTHLAWRTAGMSLAVAACLSLTGWATLGHSARAADTPQDALATIIVNSTNPAINNDGACSIIEAIENANADAAVHDDCAAGSGADVITLPNDAIILFASAHNSIGGANALPVITSTITLQGNGTTLVRDTSAPPFRFFNVAVEGDFTITELGLRNGRAGLTGTAQLLFGGGAIVNQGSLEVAESNLSFNRASFGGAIYSQSVTGTLIIDYSTFTSNIADFYGGALYNLGDGAITDGVLRLNSAGNNGGAILHDSGALTVTNAAVRDNTASGAGAGIATRTLISDSQLWLLTTAVISNVAGVNGGGIYNSASNGRVSVVDITGSIINGNRATSVNANEGIGGGIANGWTGAGGEGVASLRMSQSSILDNVAQTGGGIANLDASGYTTRTAQSVILQSTLARNTAAGVGSGRGTGGGLYNSNGTTTLANSTVSSNQAIGDDATAGGRGGGIGNVGRGITTTVQLRNVTVAFNEATQAGGGIAVLGQVSGTTTVLNSANALIVSNALSATPSISNVAVLAGIASPLLIPGTESCSLESGTSVSLGGNIEDGTSCELDTATDLQNTDVALGALADNGGPTQTHAITSTGAAFDGGVDAICAAAPVSGVDQRGIVRPQSVACDVGAVELVGEPVEEGFIMYFPQIYLRHSFQ